MPIEVDFGTELGTVVFPEDYTQEQAFDFVKQNRKQIQQNLIQRRQQEMASETSQLEAAKYRAGEYGTLETIGGVVSELPKAITEGFGGAMKGAERAATFFPPPTVNPYTGRPIQQTVEPTGPGALSKAGQAVQEFGRETFPTLPGVQESIPAQIAGGVGSTLSVLPGALLAGPVGAGALYGLSAGEAGAEDARRVINRRIAERLAAGDSQGAEDLQAQASQLESQAFLLNAAIGGVSEGVLGVAGKIRFGKSNIGGVGARLAERMIPKAASLRTQNMIRGGVEGVVTEGLQESLEQSMGNMAAKVTYEPERGIMDGVAQAGFIGAATGGLVGGAIGSKRNPNLAKANAIAEATGTDPANPLPRSTATVSGLQDGTQSMGPIDIEPEITAEDVMRTSQEAGLAGQEEEVIPASKPQPKSKAAPVTPEVDIVRLDDLRKKANTGTINPDELAELTLMHQTMGIPDPVVAATPATPTTTPTPAAATVDAETGLRSDEQDELDQLITAEDEGLLSEQGAITLAAYRARLGGVEPAAIQTQPTISSAVQEQGPSEGVLRAEEQQPPIKVGLRQVDQGGRPAESSGAEVQVTPQEVRQVKAAVVVAPAPVAKPVAKPVAATKPAEELTEKQYYDQRVKEIADANSIGQSEVRDLFSQEDANLEYWQLIQKAAESGKQFKSQSLDRLPQARVEFLRRNFPQSIPQGYFYPGVVKTIAPAPTYTPARINKLLQSLKARATAVGKGLYEIKKLAPGQRLVLRDSYGRLQETDQFLLREKSEVTGNVYDEGFILRDKQEYAAGQAPKPAPAEVAPAEPVAAEPTEAELQAAEEARLAQAEQEIDAGPIGQAKQKLEDEGSDMKKSQVKAMARKLEASGIIDDSELDDEGRDTGVDELVGQLLERIEEARDTAIQEREQELADEAKAEKVVQKPAPAPAPTPVPTPAASAPAKKAAKDPATMTASEINKELDRLSAESSAVTQELIDAGRGSELSNETLKKTDPLSLRALANNKRQLDLLSEISSRAGPNMSRLPAGQKGFGPRKTAAQSAIDAIDKVSKGLSENSYSDPLFLTPLAKLALQIAKGLIQVGVAVDKAIRQAIAQARQQFPNDPTDDIQLADRLIRDAEYAAAVAAGDMETAQRMVDEAAVKAGYKTKGFHRTPKAFTKFIPGGPKAEAQFWTTKAGEFRTLFGQSGRAIWFGSSPENLPAYHNDSTGSGVVLEVYLKNPSPLQIDDDTRAWGRDIYADGSKQFPLLLSDEHIQSIRKDGYTGIEYWNNGKTADKSAPDEMVVFDANQIKSADPVTRDDEGNVVPLSQRFQSSTADIRGESGAYRGIGKRLSDWARNDTDEATRQVRFTNPSTGEQATFGDVISDLQSISDEAAPEYVRWLQSIPNKSTATADIVSDITWISRLETEAERNQRPDRVEAILKKVIAATDPKGKVFEAIAGLSNFVVFQATKIALRIYQATKSWVAARNAGMDYIKSHVQLSNEAETAANFEEHIKAFPNQEIPAGTPERPQPPSPSERVESRGIFRGDVTRDTDENWQSEARKWVDFYKGNLELAYQRFLGARIDNALREYVGGELLQRSELEVARAKNPIDLLRALDLQTRIAGSLVQAGSDFGKQGRARQLTFARYAWMVPQLVYRRLVNEQQKRKIPFPEIVAQQVREWLVESGQEAIDQVKEAMKQADNVFAREFKKIKQVPGQPGGPPIEIKWRDILTKSLQTQGSVRQKMLQVILADPQLRNLSPAGIAEITNLLTTAWENKRNQIFRAEFRKKVPLPTVKPDAREKLFRSLPRILKYANIARATPGDQITNDGPETFLLWDQAFRDAVAPEFGVAEINGLTARKLTELAQRAQAAQGVNRNQIIQEMFRMMARDGGVRFSDVLRDYWYAAVLSGTRTQLDNALNILNGALNTVMLAGMAGKEAGLVTKSALKGLDEGLRDFWPMLWRGELYRSVNFNPDQPSNALEGLGESRNLFAKGISQAKYVSRLMLALDHVTAMMSDGAAKAYALNKEVGPEEARNLMLPDKAEVQAARDRAIAEGTRPDLVNKRTREILQESFPVDVLMTSKDIREAVTFTEVPQGLMGSLYEGLNAASRKFPALKFLTGTNFVRFAANYTNELLNYAAPIAVYRWIQSAPGKSDQPGGLQYSPARRDLLRAKAALGTALGATAAALFLGDDDKEEDRDIDITGSFKSLDPNKRKQLLAEGRQPYSIRVGDTYISYRQLGFGGLLGAIGELRDRQLFEPEKWNEESIIGKVQDAATAGLFIVKDSSAISGLTEFLGFANAYKYDTNEIVEKSAPRYLARLGGSFVPNILKEVDAWSDPSIFKAEPGGLGHEYFLQQVPYARREIGPGPILNVLGEPVRVERYPYSRWVTQRSEDPAWNTLGQLASKGVFMPVPAITVKVNENGTRRELTREEKYQYQQAVGQGYRKFIEQNRDRLLALPPAQASDLIDKNADRIRRNARTNLKNSF